MSMNLHSHYSGAQHMVVTELQFYDLKNVTNPPWYSVGIMMSLSKFDTFGSSLTKLSISNHFKEQRHHFGFPVLPFH